MCEVPLSRHVSTLFKYDTEFCADSVEWCPHEPFQNVFVCANYQLKESSDDNPRERFGRILLFSFSRDNGLKLHQTINTAAVLDQKWCHNQIENYSILGVVNAKKTLEIYKLNPELIELDLITSYQIVDDNSETLLLSLDWSTGKYPSNCPEIVSSDSKGNIHRFSLINNKLELEESWHGHEFEAWIAGFYYWDPNVIFSGGDDCCFLKFDRRCGNEPIARNRSHDAGVTSLHSNPTKEFSLATGSYDSKVRLWDMRFLKNCVNSIEMPGTLWRLKWDPIYNNYLLAACMLGGIHIINAKNTEDLKIIASCYEHKNITYGADWSYLPPGSDDNIIIGTCSFYDHLLCISELTLPEK